MVTVKQLQMKYRNDIEDALKDRSYSDIASIGGVTEQTIRNAVKSPSSVKIETLERIANKLKESK